MLRVFTVTILMNRHRPGRWGPFDRFRSRFREAESDFEEPCVWVNSGCLLSIAFWGTLSFREELHKLPINTCKC